MQLVCFPHAGGSASWFRPWSALLPDAVELLVVQYPGREDRFGEPLSDSMDELVAGVCDELAGLLHRPYVLFGHSMGAVVAYEAAQELRNRGVAGMRRLIASGRETPQVRWGGDVHRRDDEGLAAELSRLGGTPAEVLAEPELRRAVLDHVRNDYRLIECYRPRPHPPLDCPVTAFTGDRDPELSVDGATAWAALGRPPAGRPDVEVFPGGHFYLGPRRAEVVRAVVRRMDPVLAGAPSLLPSMP